jgi:hypothetical protein
VAQETDFEPNTTDLASWTWTQYEEYVTRKLSPFGPGIAETALRLYPSHVITPEYQLTSLTSDLGTICGSGDLAFRAYNRQGFSAPIYRYVGTSCPSKPIALHQFGDSFLGSYSMHVWDLFAFFGTIDQCLTPTAPSDLAWQARIRREVTSFVRAGHPASPEWKPYPHGTAILTGNDTIEFVDNYKQQECAFLQANGFLNYGWIN